MLSTHANPWSWLNRFFAPFHKAEEDRLKWPLVVACLEPGLDNTTTLRVTASLWGTTNFHSALSLSFCQTNEAKVKHARRGWSIDRISMTGEQESVWGQITWSHHAVSVRRGWEAIGRGGVVHEDGQRRIHRQRSEGVGTERLACHPSLASLLCSFIRPGLAAFPRLRLPLPPGRYLPDSSVGTRYVLCSRPFIPASVKHNFGIIRRRGS